jgi:hypothetical protein
LGFIEKTSIGVSAQDHVASSIDDAVVWVGSNIVQEVVDRLLSSNSGFGLLGRNGTESHKEFVVYCKGVVKEGPDNFLDAVLAVIIKEGRGINFRGELCLGTIGDR